MRRCLMLLVLLVPTAASADKSNQVRPTPSPILRPELREGELVLTPKVAYARYRDELGSGIAGYPYEYDITSAGLVLQAQYALRDWLHLSGTLESYRKLGTIVGPSPGDISKLVEAHVLGWAQKVGVQADVRVYERDAGGKLGDVAVYLFGKGLIDIFRQDQKEPLSSAHFAENAFVYRLGGAAHLGLIEDLYLAPFAGLEGFVFSGEQIVRTPAEEVVSTGGSEGPYPFFGGDVLWTLGAAHEQALSLGAILALAAEDDSGFGGKLLTINAGYTLAF